MRSLVSSRGGEGWALSGPVASVGIARRSVDSFWCACIAAVFAAAAMVLTPAVALPAEEPAAASSVAAAEPTAAEPAAVAPAAAAPTMSTEDMVKNLWLAADTVWVLVCGMLVFFMNLGFGCVESGFARAKNCVNILSKNFVVFAATAIGFWFIGWDLMFGTDAGGWIGNSGSFMVGGAALDKSPAIGDQYSGPYAAISWASVPLWAKFFFQLVFAGTAATIVSGAVAERIRYHSFILFSFLMALVIYPVTGHWVWGGGFLGQKGFWDFAGCTVVHSVGGWAALTGAIILGPRIGKYAADGRVQAIPGHNMTAAFIGCLVLWFGWFGFNPGSTMGVAGDGGVLAAQVAVNTNSAAAAATLTATITAWLLLGKPDIGMTLNGCLAGLVGITASAAFVTVPASLLIGAIAGVLVVYSVLFFDKMHVDDPVGATSVHLVCGIFGTLCVGLFTEKDLSATQAIGPFGIAAVGGPKAGLFYGGGLDQLWIQLMGVLAVAAYVVPISAIAWLVLKALVGLRVSPQEEIEGLDIGEHGNEAYHGFVLVRTE